MENHHRYMVAITKHSFLPKRITFQIYTRLTARRAKYIPKFSKSNRLCKKNHSDEISRACSSASIFLLLNTKVKKKKNRSLIFHFFWFIFLSKKISSVEFKQINYLILFHHLKMIFKLFWADLKLFNRNSASTDYRKSTRS